MAFQSLFAVGTSLNKCENFFDDVIELTEEYIAARLVSVYGNTTNFGDTTALMELLGIIGSKSCSAPQQLFDDLLLLCTAPTTAVVQSFALDSLLQAIIERTNDEDKQIESIDDALDVNDCVQHTTLPTECKSRLAAIYEGDSLYYSQYIFTLQEFKEGKVRIDIPNATVIFPKNFDIQIKQDYRLTTGDPVIRFSCVGINMVRTDAILATDVPIDSAIVGMTAMVNVNGSAVTIDLGHKGEPARDIILRIYRQNERDNGEKRSERDRESEEKEIEKRVNLDDDCGEEISCAYYEGEGILSTTGCFTSDVTDEYVDCSCNHYSNFGLLFSESSSCADEWTVLRILSLVLLALCWLLIFTLIALIEFSQSFRIATGWETQAEKRIRAYGNANPNQNYIDQ
uniref:GPS domain-containing protein n=2 Tax=Paramoeba aestuarina TaxID=180227 RepID=A0A7S4NLT0_9EUKA|mmetsp:Transcript_19594/g.30698  ORF Transcript_19594/g.30698 Transcript_19594/m.30698 type:complete len:399 (+) Transcript_19594:612-1808(+)